MLLLEIGADDNVVKPFSPRELLARIRAVLRRASPFERVIRFGDVEVDLDRRLITPRGQEINLTNTRTVDAHVVRLRQKLELDPATPRHVLTIHGLGYRFLILGKSCLDLRKSCRACWPCA